MSTDGNLPDLKFPQTGGQGNSIHLSASTLKQHGRNGERAEEPFVVAPPPPLLLRSVITLRRRTSSGPAACDAATMGKRG